MLIDHFSGKKHWTRIYTSFDKIFFVFCASTNRANDGKSCSVHEQDCEDNLQEGSLR